MLDLQPRREPLREPVCFDGEFAEMLRRDHQSYKAKHPEFSFTLPEDFLTRNETEGSSQAWFAAIARAMAEIYTLDPTFRFTNKSRGRFAVPKDFLKKIVRKFGQPFIRLLFAQQHEMNRQTILLAQAIVALDARMAALENILRVKTDAH